MLRLSEDSEGILNEEGTQILILVSNAGDSVAR